LISFYKCTFQERKLVYVFIIIFITGCRERCNIIRDILVKKIINAVENLKKGLKRVLYLDTEVVRQKEKLPCSPEDYPKLCHLEHSGLRI